MLMIGIHARKWNSKIQLFHVQKIRYIQPISSYHSYAITQQYFVRTPRANLQESFNHANRYYCTGKPLSSPKDEGSLKRRLIAAAREYGPIVIILHVTLSLASLGFFFSLIYFGIDLSVLLRKCGIELEKIDELGSFVIAYAIHKSLAPFRMATTLACTPFVVQKLKKMGILQSILKRK